MPGVKAPGFLMQKNRKGPGIGPFQEKMNKKY
jgi:hypothetical protein